MFQKRLRLSNGAFGCLSAAPGWADSLLARSHSLIQDRLTDSLDAMPVVENKESAGRRPDEQLLLGELSSQVQSALTKLSPDLREAVVLRDLQQLDYAEIQQVLAVPEGTVKSRINRGRIELARILQQMGVGPS